MADQLSDRAEIALSVGAADIKAIAKDDIEMSNLWSQTDMTIQVGWSGGGHIKSSKYMPA